MSVTAALITSLVVGGLESGPPQWVEMGRVLPATDDQGGWFGTSLDADGTALIIGSPLNGPGAATVVLLSETEQAIEQTYEVVASDGRTGDRFGIDVAIGGLPEGGGLAFVGAFGWDVYVDDVIDLADAGAVYMYSEPGDDGPLIESKITLASPEGAQWFGYALSLDGLTLAVGAPKTGTNETINDQGIVYVYEIGATGTVGPPVLIDSPSPAENGWFGTAVAVDGDRLVVGELYSEAGASLGGAVHVFERTAPATWVHVDTVVSDEPAFGGGFGYKVDLSGDTMVVSEPFYDSIPDDPDDPDNQPLLDDGLVHVFDLVDGAWVHAQRIPCPFPASVGWGIDLDLEESNLVVGSHTWTGNADTTGFAAALSRVDGVFQIERLMTREDAPNFSYTGFAVAAMSEVDLIAVGCPEADQEFGGKVVLYGPTCPGDSSADRVVGVPDLLQLLSHWGDSGIYPVDDDQDYVVGIIDLQLLLFENWGCDWEGDSSP